MPKERRATLLRDCDEAMVCLATRETADPRNLPMELAALQAEMETEVRSEEWKVDHRIEQAMKDEGLDG